MVSQFSWDNIWLMFLQKKNVKIDHDCDFNDFWVDFFGQNRGKILSSLNFETICGIFSPRWTFSTPNMKENFKAYFLTSIKFSKFYLMSTNQKKQFLWEKNDIVLLFTSHGTGLAPKTWKKLSSVKNKTPYWAQRAFDYIRKMFNWSREMGSGSVKLAISTQN